MKSAQKILRHINDLQNNLRGREKIDPELFNSITILLEEIVRGVLAGRLEISKQLLSDIRHCLDMIYNVDFKKKPLTQMGMSLLDKVMDGITEELTITNFSNNQL